MADLLIIADDFTGALDTGVHFAACGAQIRVLAGTKCEFSAHKDTQVLVMNAETRHLPPKEAYAVVYEAVRRAREAGIFFIYKKTDSALRGNVGAELSAAMDASGREKLIFAPALPRMNRIVKKGVLYIDGMPAAESDFGEDPFEPVRASSVAEIIAEQTSKPIHIHAEGDHSAGVPGIHVFDATSEKELFALAKRLGPKEMALSAGCAGFASTLPALLGLRGKSPALPKLPNSILMVCGSVNPVTIRQMDQAEKTGYRRIRLTQKQKLDSAWLYTPSGEETIREWLRAANESPLLMLDVNRADGEKVCQREEGDEAQVRRMRAQIAVNMGLIVRRLLDCGLRSMMMCTGGDTLVALMRALDVTEFTPICELAPGVVLTVFTYQGQEFPMIAKSGGFGKPELLCQLMEKIRPIMERGDIRC